MNKFRNNLPQREIRTEKKYARQFVMCIILIILLMISIGYHIYLQTQYCDFTFSTAYKIQLAFIPILFIIMAFYFYRLYNKNMNRILFEQEEKTENSDHK